METKNVISAEVLPDKSIKLTISDPIEGETTAENYTAIRAGISWPTAQAPSYFCLVGQKYIKPGSTEAKREFGKRVLLAEISNDSLSLTSKFFPKIVDLSVQFLCWSFYAELPEERIKSGFLNDLEGYLRERDSRACIHAAEDADNFLLGLSRIKGDIDRGDLLIPEDSFVYEQLKSITKEDLKGSPEDRFFAVNGLRHALGSFHRQPPRLRKPSRQAPPPNWRAF